MTKHARYRRRLVSRGLCRGCGRRPHRPGITYCASCARSHSKAEQRRHRANRSEGLCRCGRPRQQGRTLCPECVERDREHGRRRQKCSACPRRRILVDGLCRRCRAPCMWCEAQTPIDGLGVCLECDRREEAVGLFGGPDGSPNPSAMLQAAYAVEPERRGPLQAPRMNKEIVGGNGDERRIEEAVS